MSHLPAEVIMPALGMSQETGRLVAWLKQEGDAVERGEILMEIETDKTTVEVEAMASGILANVTAKAGDDVPVGQVIALILAPGEKAPSVAQKAMQIPDTSQASSMKAVTPVAKRMAQAHDIDISQVQTEGKRITRADVQAHINGKSTAPDRILASPKARRLAQEQGIELADISGTGPDGAVLAADVLNFTLQAEAVSNGSPTQTPAQTGMMWQRMAQRLTESWQTIPHFYLKREVSAAALLTWRKQVMSRSSVKVTYTDLLVKLVAKSLGQHPHVNGQWTGNGVVFNEQVHIGLAVAVDDGLLVPVIHNADTLGITAIAQRRQAIVERAHNKKLQPADLQNGTFTISNLGMFGVDEFSAIVNPPQAAILAVGNIVEKVVPVAGAAQIRPMLVLSLSCDHRAVDGARGAQFLATLAQLIEDPLRLLD